MNLGQPGQLATIVKSIPGRDTVNDRLIQLEKITKQLVTSAKANFTTVTGIFKVIGSIDVTGTATFEGDTDIGGNLVVSGTLALPNGIIGDDALTNPIASAVGNHVLNAFTLTNTLTTIDTVTIAVPAGFTTANVHAITHIFALSSTASPTVIANTTIAGNTSLGGITRGAVGDIVETVDSFAVQLTGISGSFTITVLGSASSCDAGAGTSIISANIIFTR